MESEWVDWTPEKRYKVGSEIYDELGYKKILWTCGFIKTSISSALFVIGFTLLFNGLTNHPLFSGWNESAIFFGVLAIVFAFIVIYVIDKKREIMKKEQYGKEQEHLEKRLFENKAKADEEVDELVHSLIDKKISEVIYEQLETMSRVKFDADNDDYRFTSEYDESSWEQDLYS